MEDELQVQGRLAVRKREHEKRQFEDYLHWQRSSRASDELPPPGLVRKSKSHLSVISHDDDEDDRYFGRDGYRIPIHSTRSDDQVLPQFAPYNSGKGKPGSTPMHLLDDRRHSAFVGDDETNSGGRGLTTSSTYDSLAKVKESMKMAERSSKAKSSTMDPYQVKIYHSPVAQGSSSGTSTVSGSSNSSSGARSKRNGGGNSVNLQALTMLPGASSSNYSSKMKQPSPLATKRMDARNGDGSRTDYAPSSRIPQSSRSTTKVKKSKQMNGLPTNLDFDFMNRGSLSQPVEDMTSELYYPRTKFSPEVVPVSYGETDGSNSRNFYRSASDESVYDTLRTSSRNSRTSKQVKDFNVKESRSWAKSFALSVFGSFSSADKEKGKSNKHKNRKQQSTQSSEATGGQSATLFSSNSSKTQGRFHHTYSHNQKASKIKTPSKKHTEMLSPDDQVEHKSVRFVSESRKQQNPSLPSAAQSSHSSSSHTHKPHSSHTHHDAGNMAQLSGVPTRSPPTTVRSKGAQAGATNSSVFSSDMPLTSYPRSHTQAMQLRGHTMTNGHGNGRPLSNYNMVNVTRVTNGGGRGYSSRHYAQNGQFKNSLSNNNLADVAKLGSLV